LRIAAPALLLIRRPIAPVLRFLDVWVISPLSRLVAPARRHAHSEHVSPEQLGTLIDMSAGEGVLAPGEQQMLTSIVEMGHLRVEQIMTPRVDLTSISPDITMEELARVCRENKRTRMLVSRDGIDSGILGMVDARRLLEGQSMETALREVLYVPEQSRLDTLMDQLRNTGKSLAVCVDEHGGISGIVTLSDIVKELIEGLDDPQDDPASEVIMIGVGRWVVPGRLSIRDWAVMFADESLIEHTKRVNTLAGLIMVLLDRIPEPGDEARIGDILLRVEHMQGRAIDRVQVEVISDTGNPESTR
ncbi:MAG: transporter associated domain-containing protein, partial [Phycisphaerales bacterium]